MGEVINLNRVRKAKTKAAEAAKAAQNRVDFGISKLEKQASLRLQQAAAEKLDAHKLTRKTAPEHAEQKGEPK